MELKILDKKAFFFLFLILFTFICISIKAEQVYVPELNRTINIIDTIYASENSTISGEVVIPTLQENSFPSNMPPKSNYLNYLKYVFGAVPEQSYNFIFFILFWILFLVTLYFILLKPIKNKLIKIISALVLTIFLSNLKINVLLSNGITYFIKSPIARVLIVIIILLTIFLEVYLTKNNIK